MKRNEIEQLLPEIFQRTLEPGTPLYTLLEVMEDLHRSPESILANLDITFDPRRAPDKFVPYLASWVDLERIFEQPATERAARQTHRALSTGLGCLRELSANAAWLSKWRGTAKGLLRFLAIATGQDGFLIRENQTSDGRPRLYHLVVYAPESLRSHQPLLKRIIESEKPAYVTYELVLEIRAEIARG